MLEIYGNNKVQTPTKKDKMHKGQRKRRKGERGQWWYARSLYMLHIGMRCRCGDHHFLFCFCPISWIHHIKINSCSSPISSSTLWQTTLTAVDGRWTLVGIVVGLNHASVVVRFSDAVCPACMWNDAPVCMGLFSVLFCALFCFYVVFWLLTFVALSLWRSLGWCGMVWIHVAV